MTSTFEYILGCHAAFISRTVKYGLLSTFYQCFITTLNSKWKVISEVYFQHPCFVVSVTYWTKSL